MRPHARAQVWLDLASAHEWVLYSAAHRSRDTRSCGAEGVYLLLSFAVFDCEVVDGLSSLKYDSFLGSKISRASISSWGKHTEHVIEPVMQGHLL